MNSESGKWIIIAGTAIVVAGLIIYFFHNKLNWLGHLPGDIRIEKKHFKFYFPVTTMILVSVVVSFIIWLVRKIY